MSNNKQSMKLYTEEQLINYLRNHSDIITKYDLQNITPIELPSDEEVDNDIKKLYIVKWDIAGFKKGVKYIINKIQGGTNEQQ